MKKNELPNIIPVFPLSNFIIFPKTTVPLNIFETRYIKMIDDAMKGSRMIGIIQPKKIDFSKPKLYDIGCVGKITNFNETKDGRYQITLDGFSRFKIINEITSDKMYRECKITFEDFLEDFETSVNKDKLEFTNIDLIFDHLQKLFEKRGYNIDWKELKNQNLDQTINTLSMASPFSLEEKQALLETKSINLRKIKLEEILKTYVFDNFSNTTVQ